MLQTGQVTPFLILMRGTMQKVISMHLLINLKRRLTYLSNEMKTFSLIHYIYYVSLTYLCLVLFVSHHRKASSVLAVPEMFQITI